MQHHSELEKEERGLFLVLQYILTPSAVTSLLVLVYLGLISKIARSYHLYFENEFSTLFGLFH